MTRPASADEFLNRTASVLSSWSAQSSRGVELDERLRSALHQNRVRTPDAWFEKKHAEFAERDKVARRRTQELLQARRNKCQEFAVARHRVLERLASDVRPQQQMEREEMRRSLEDKLATASTRLSMGTAQQGKAILQRKQQHEEGKAERKNYFASVQREREQRADGLRRLGEGRVASVTEAVERRQQATLARAQRAQSLRQMQQQRLGTAHQQRLQQHQILMDKHHGLSEWLQSLDQTKHETLRQRKISGMASTLQRQSILQTSYDQWHQKLRSTPLPDDPQELLELARKMTPA